MDLVKLCLDEITWTTGAMDNPGSDDLGPGREWLGQHWSWTRVARTTLVLDESGSDNISPGREWLGQHWSWTTVAWTTVALDEAGPDEFGLDNVGWTSFNWMICPRPNIFPPLLHLTKSSISTQKIV